MSILSASALVPPAPPCILLFKYSSSRPLSKVYYVLIAVSLAPNTDISSFFAGNKLRTLAKLCIQVVLAYANAIQLTSFTVRYAVHSATAKTGRPVIPPQQFLAIGYQEGKHRRCEVPMTHR
ncbi:hypothetical protein B0H16DRAFT_1736711 [Mycena metata]|uniref:Uncharacterized protein n=1 Tax=Mycena metata TaxID=1033252 RepID=A0AAD7MMK6_9AGAR|nr:hypothetical protein B0H16DRAFT_1736711 [Mycena metata]